MHKPLLTLAILSLPMTNATAADFPMWGVGPQLGTIVVPGAYPMSFPKTVRDNPDTTLQAARFDLQIGARGVAYASKRSRVGAILTTGFGQGFSQTSFLGTYEVELQRGVIDWYAGGGIGFGGQRWNGDGSERLQVPSYPARVSLSGQYRNGQQAYGLSAYGQVSIPSRHLYTDAAGTQTEDVGGVVSFTNYMHFGLELTAMFGDFELREPKSKKGKKGKKGKA